MVHFLEVVIVMNPNYSGNYVFDMIITTLFVISGSLFIWVPTSKTISVEPCALVHERKRLVQ